MLGTWVCLGLGGGVVGCDSESSQDTDVAADETSAETDPAETTRVHVHAAGADGIAAAAVLAEGSITMYVCGDAQTVQSHTRWFFSLPIGPDGAFEGTDEGWTLSGSLSSDVVEAQLLTPDGETLTLGFDPISDTDAPGLYVSSGPGCQTGLVAWDDPSAPGGVGFQGAWCDADGTKEQVIILQPDAFTAEGGQAQVQGRDDVEPFAMMPF